MTGATDITGSSDALSFRLPRAGRNGINGVRIACERDLYTIEFWRLTRRFDERVLVEKSEDIGVEDLCRVFAETTGLEIAWGAPRLTTKRRGHCLKIPARGANSLR